MMIQHLYVVDSPPLELDAADFERQLQLRWMNATVTAISTGYKVSLTPVAHEDRYHHHAFYSTENKWFLVNYDGDAQVYYDFVSWLLSYLPAYYKLAATYSYLEPHPRLFVFCEDDDIGRYQQIVIGDVVQFECEISWYTSAHPDVNTSNIVQSFRECFPEASVFRREPDSEYINIAYRALSATVDLIDQSIIWTDFFPDTTAALLMWCRQHFDRYITTELTFPTGSGEKQARRGEVLYYRNFRKAVYYVLEETTYEQIVAVCETFLIDARH